MEVDGNDSVCAIGTHLMEVDGVDSVCAITTLWKWMVLTVCVLNPP